MFELNNFDQIQIGIASPEQIRKSSYGEVTKPETINYRTQKPEKDGLFCEKIFGPTKDYECNCGKYKRIRYKGIVCDKCGVLVTKSKVRRDRMGHIELAAPVTHIWYYKGTPSRIGTLLGISAKDLDQVIYFMNYIVLDPGNTNLEKKQIINHKTLEEMREIFGANNFRVGMGAEAIEELLKEIDLQAEAKLCRSILDNANGQIQERVKAAKKLELVESFMKSGIRPEWMILHALPVLPPDLRPMVQLDGGRYASSDLNELYRRLVNRNNRLKKMQELNAPEIIVRNEKRMLQEAVDALIDNGRRGKPVTGAAGRELKSLSALLRGKQGRFRQNLLGKRVDYSGRSVIVVGPTLKLYQCGLPKEMALELFKPFVMRMLIKTGKSTNAKNARKMVERTDPNVWDALETVIKDHPVLLNRAPTLHRLGIQAFEPVLVEGRAIKIHPLVCAAFNADFDGDQMAIHVPLSIEAQTEARFLMLSANNILKLSDGKPVVTPSQDMVMGCYYLTLINEEGLGKGRAFMDEDEAIMAYDLKQISLQSEIYVRVKGEIYVKGDEMRAVKEGDEEYKKELIEKGFAATGEIISKRLLTTVGKIIFNRAIPQDLGFVDRTDKDKLLDQEVDFVVNKKKLGVIVEKCFNTRGATDTVVVLDRIKSLGFKYSTIGAVTASIFDMHVPQKKKEILEAAEEEVIKTEKYYARGRITEEERYKKVIDIWKKATDDVTEEMKGTLEKFNPIWMMADSGARGSMKQIRQLSGMRGLMADPTGKTIEVPVKASFREGLSVLEYFISSHGGRKGLADTALKTANSGYLTRRLVDVSHEVIVREEKCSDTKGMAVGDLRDSTGEIKEPIHERVEGRFVVNDVIHPETGEVIVPKDTMITPAQADVIGKWNKYVRDNGLPESKLISKITIFSVLNCNTKYGVCCRCYGKNMANGKPVQIGEVVGTIAAQSIGEPGTQLTMRTFHSGGVATSDDITQGLPRVEELFEARRPKGQAVISEIAGKVSIKEDKKTREITVKGKNETRTYRIPFVSKIKVTEGQMVSIGEPLTIGSINPADIMETTGVPGVQEYLITEVKLAYKTSGVDIADKHIEVIVRQMLRKARVEKSGDTDLLPGQIVDIFDLEEKNAEAAQNGRRPALAKRILLSITKTALATESFLSAASFQETAKVLTDAAIKGKKDKLIGLKENVIIGKLIPAGTGMKRYREVSTSEARYNAHINFVPVMDEDQYVPNVTDDDEEE